MMPRITQDLRQLLVEVLRRRCPDVTAFTHDGTFRALSKEERERIVDALAAELTEGELASDGEPTQRGLKIDGLIGYFVPYDLPMHPTRGAGGYE